MNYQNKKNFYNNKIMVLFILSLSLLILILFLLRNIYNFDFIVMIILIFMFILFFDTKPYLFIKYFFSIFYCVYMLFGLFICNNSNLYLYEIEMNSHYNGSFPIAVLYYIIFFVSLIIFDKFFSTKFKYYISNRKAQQNEKKGNIIYISIFVIGLIMFLSVVRNPSFKFGVDRFKYKNMYLPNWLSKIQSSITYCVPFVIFPIIYKKKKVNLKTLFFIFITFMPFIMYGIWTGNKFGLFLNILILIMSPIIVYIEKKNLMYSSSDNLLIKKELKKFNNNRKIKKYFLISILILVILLFPYYYFRKLDFKNSMIDRAAQQGQLWWATFEIEKDKNMHLEELNDEFLPVFNSIFKKPIPQTYGIYKIMQLTTPKNRYQAKISSFSRYSAQGIEIAFYYFKYFGVFVQPIIRAFFEALLVNLLVKYIFSCKFINTYIFSKLIIINHFIFTQGDLYMLFSPTTIFLIILFVILNLIRKKEEIYKELK